MKYEVYRNDPLNNMPRVLLGKVSSKEAAEKLIALDRMNEGFRDEMVFGQSSYSITKIKPDPKPSAGSGQQNQS